MEDGEREGSPEDELSNTLVPPTDDGPPEPELAKDHLELQRARVQLETAKAELERAELLRKRVAVESGTRGSSPPTAGHAAPAANQVGQALGLSMMGCGAICLGMLIVIPILTVSLSHTSPEIDVGSLLCSGAVWAGVLLAGLGIFRRSSGLSSAHILGPVLAVVLLIGTVGLWSATTRTATSPHGEPNPGQGDRLSIPAANQTPEQPSAVDTEALGDLSSLSHEWKVTSAEIVREYLIASSAPSVEAARAWVERNEPRTRQLMGIHARMDAAAQAIQHQRLRAIVTKVVSNYRDKLDGLVRLIRAVSVLDGDAEQSAIQAIESTTKAGVAIAHEYMTVMRDMGVTDKEISEGLARGAKETDQLMQGNQPR